MPQIKPEVVRSFRLHIHQRFLIECAKCTTDLTFSQFWPRMAFSDTKNSIWMHSSLLAERTFNFASLELVKYLTLVFYWYFFLIFKYYLIPSTFDFYECWLGTDEREWYSLKCFSKAYRLENHDDLIAW